MEIYIACAAVVVSAILITAAMIGAIPRTKEEMEREIEAQEQYIEEWKKQKERSERK